MSATALAIAAANAAVASGLAYATVAPTCSFWGPLIARGPAESQKIALTFDDGPTPGATCRVLDVLRDAQVKATFFVVGVNVRDHADLLRRVHSEGHLIGNHTLDHSHYGLFGMLPYWKEQLAATDELVESIVGVRPALFRPPMGVKTWNTTRAARALGHTVITWTRRAIDGFPTTAKRIVQRLCVARGGEILLLHDGVEPHAPHHDRTATIEALGPLIARLRSRGLSPVRLDELLGIPGYQSREATAGTAT